MFVDAYDVVKYDIVYGAVNVDIFNKFFLEDLSPHIESYPGKHSLIMIDNVPFHHNVQLQEMVDALGAILLFLPTYKPNWNPVEFYFNAIKMIEKRKQVAGDKDLAMLSLAESVEEMKGSDYSGKHRQIGYYN